MQEQVALFSPSSIYFHLKRNIKPQQLSQGTVILGKERLKMPWEQAFGDSRDEELHFQRRGPAEADSGTVGGTCRWKSTRSPNLPMTRLVSGVKTSFLVFLQ